MIASEALAQAAVSLSRASISSAQLDAELLLGYAWDRTREWLMAHPEAPVPEAVFKKFTKMVELRSQREPLVHLTGAREFYGLDLEITPDVLTPRVETEQMAEWAIKYAPTGSKLVDIGTGSGALAIAIAKNRPDLEVWATDVTKEAVQVAKRNAKKFGLNIKFVQSDLWQAINERFTTIVTNLPYLKNDAELMPEVRREPAVALFGGSDGLDLYRRFLRDLPKHLEPGGYLFTECDPWQQDDLIKEAERVGLKPIERGYFIMGFQMQ